MQKTNILLIDLDGTLLQVKTHRARFKFVMLMIIWWLPYAPPWKTIRALKTLVTSMKHPHTSKGSNVSCHNRKRLSGDCDKIQSNYHRGLTSFVQTMNLAENEVEDLLAQSTAEIFKKLKKYFSPVNGAKEFMLWAREKYTLFLVTNPVWPPEIVTMRLQWAGLDSSLFLSYTHSKRMSFCKADPEFFKEFLVQEKLNSNACLMIGDNPNEDGNAAQLGIRTFFISKRNPTKSYEKLKMILETADNSPNGPTKQETRCD